MLLCQFGILAIYIAIGLVHGDAGPTAINANGKNNNFLQRYRPTNDIDTDPERAKNLLRPVEVVEAYMKPFFMMPLENVNQVEGFNVHIESKVEPFGDPTMHVQWFLNGRPLQASSRCTFMFQGGMFTLDLLSVSAADGGTYVCRATSATGVAESRFVLTIQPRMPAVPGELQETAINPEPQRQELFFTAPLQDATQVVGGTFQFLGKIEQSNDDTLNVQWFFNGRPLTTSYLPSNTAESGDVTLDLPNVSAANSGVYVCRVTTATGVAESRAVLTIQPRRLQKKVIDPEPARDRPSFVMPFQDETQVEGGNIHFEGKLEPFDDPTMHVQWFLNGRSLKASSRCRFTFQDGLVTLDLLSVSAADFGQYVCRATSASGVAQARAFLYIQKRTPIEQSSQRFSRPQQNWDDGRNAQFEARSNIRRRYPLECLDGSSRTVSTIFRG